MSARRLARQLFRILLLGAILASVAGEVSAAAKAAVATGNWNTPGTWSPVGVPAAGDTCTINDAVTITVNTAAVCGSLTMGDATNNGNSTLTLAAGGSLDITTAGGQSGNVNFDPAGNGRNYTIAAATQTLTIRGAVTSSNSGAVNDITVSTGQVLFTAAFTWPAGPRLTVTNNNAGGSVVFSGLLTQTGGTIRNTTTAGTITFNGGYTKSGGTFTTFNGETINFGGNLTVSGGALTFTNTSIARFTSTATITPTSAITFSSLTIDSGASTVSLAGNVSVARDLSVTTGIFDLATFTANRTAGGGTLTVSAGALLKIGGTNTFPTNYTTHTLNATSTVEYSGTAQTVTAETYGNLTLSGSGNKTIAAGTVTIAGNLSVNGGTYLGSTNNPTVNLAGNFTNNATFTQGTGTFTLNGTTAQAIGGTTTTTFNNLTISNTSAAVSASTNFNVNGTLNMNGAATVLTPAAAVIVGGTGTLSGTGTVQVTRTAATADFSSQYTITNKTLTNLTVEYIGTAAQTVSALTYGNLKINNSNNVSLAGATTVNTLLTLSNGRVDTGGNSLITAASCAAPSVSRTNGWVNGNLRKAIPAGASTCTFEIGDANNYTPAVLVFVAGTGAGNLTGSTTGSDHPQIGPSGMDATNSVNRFWTFTNAGVTLPAAGYTATFNFINGSPVDVDNLGSVGTYIVELWTGTDWLSTTLAGSCTATPVTNLCKQINGETGFGDFAIGAPLSGFNPNPGGFNTFETTASTTQILGRIFTKLAGTSFTLSVVAIANNARNAAPSTNQLTVEIVNSSGTPGAFSAATNCWSGWTSVQSQTVGAPVGWTSGRVNVTINAPTQAVRDARIRVTQAGTGLIGCSTDRFTVRPAAFTISSSANNNGSGAGTTVKTGANFSITAQPVRSDLVTNITIGYDGTPSIDNTNVVGSPNAGTIGGSFSAAAGGAATGSSLFYSEVGNFGLNANAIFDSSFTVDSPSDCTADFSNVLVGGKYGCSIGHGAIAQTTGSSGFGRFIPDNFAVGLNTPTLTATCGTFSYVGQQFTYGTAPILTVTARNGTTNGLTNATTRNYAGVYMKLTNASLAAAPYDTQAGRYSRFDALGGGTTPGLVTTTTGFPDTTTDPAISFPAASLTSGVGTLTFGTGTAGLLFGRSTSTPNAPFNADIALKLNVVDSDNITSASNPVSFGAASSGNGIAFSGGNNAIRYGRIRILNASGPTTVDVPVTLNAEYYVSAGTGFATNAADNCTSFIPKNFVLFGHQPSLTTANMVSPTGATNGNVSISGSLTAGVANLKLLKPSPAVTTPGAVKICLDLDSAPGVGDTTCQAATPANQAYLQGPWSGSSNFDKDPSAQVNLGFFGAQPRNFIFFRENY